VTRVTQAAAWVHPGLGWLFFCRLAGGPPANCTSLRLTQTRSRPDGTGNSAGAFSLRLPLCSSIGNVGVAAAIMEHGRDTGGVLCTPRSARVEAH
jgi:hypothetical protein